MLLMDEIKTTMVKTVVGQLHALREHIERISHMQVSSQANIQI